MFLSFVRAAALACALLAVSALPVLAADPIDSKVNELLDSEKFDEALPIIDSQIESLERQYGPNDARLAPWLKYKTEALIYSGRPAEAEPVARRLVSLIERTTGAKGTDAVFAYTLLSDTFLDRERYREAEPFARRALEISEQTKNSEEIAKSLRVLAAILRNLSQLTEAEALLTRAMGLLEKSRQVTSITGGLVLEELAMVYRFGGRYIAGEATARRALTVMSDLTGPRSFAAATAIKEIAANLQRLGRFDEAEQCLRDVVAIFLQLTGPDSFVTAQSLLTLAGHLDLAEKYEEADANFRRGLAIMDKVRGPDDYQTAIANNNFAAYLADRGRWTEAEALMKRSLIVLERPAHGESRDYALGLNALAALYMQMKRYDETERLIKRAAAVLEKLGGPRNADLIGTSFRLAELYMNQERHNEAIQTLEKLIAAGESGSMSAKNMADALRYLGDQLIETRSYDKAERTLMRALATHRKVLSPGHRSIGRTLRLLAILHMLMGKTTEAYQEAKEAAEILAKQIGSLDALSGKDSPFETRELDDLFALRVMTTWARASLDQANEPRLRDEAFEAAQQIGFDQTARALSRMANRFSATSTRLGELLRRQKKLLAALPQIESSLAFARASGDPSRNAEIQALAKNEANFRAQLQSIDAQLRAEHPAYIDLIESRPLSAATTQQLLGQDEAIVLFAETDRGIFSFAVTKDGFVWSKSNVALPDLNKRIATLRKQLDPENWNSSFSPFNRQIAYTLYRDLWAPLEKYLAGKQQVFVVTTGALTSLPLSVLITEPPVGGAIGDATPQTLRDTPWLIKRHALISLPSIANLKALRVYANKGHGSEQFVGFGDPDFDGTQNAPFNRSVASMYRGNEPDLQSLRELQRLPETAKEIKAIAKALGASEVSDVYLGPRATEAQVKSIDLSHKRVVAFATHGFIAGDLGVGEPGLALTPPRGATEKDNGYLSASEIANLDMRADWVILSACSTAAGDTPGAKGFSGLTRAFFLAGARSVLVSHWPVWDHTAPRLTAGTVGAFQKDPKIGRAGALRKAMLDLMADKSDPLFAHPAAWAPFVAVGETRAN